MRWLDGVVGTAAPSGRRWAASLLLACFLALAFQGSRGIWEPDEGFYSNVAAGMVHSGDYWIPRLNGEEFLDKPPLTYWGLAAGLRTFGFNEWGARAAHAFWFVATALFVGLLAAAMWEPARGPEALAVYALMLGPFIATNILTPDGPLTFCVAGAALSAWKWTQASERARRYGWALLFGLAVGLGILAKGPAMLIFAFPLSLFVLVRRGWRGLLAGDLYAAAIVGLAVGGSWYAATIWRVPGAFEYLFDSQVSGRLWSARYDRNADALGAVRVYLPVLLLGSLPWCVVWFRRLVTAGSGRWARLTAGWRSWTTAGDGGKLFLILGICLPVVILSLARSRLPLYVFPIFPLVAVASSARPWSRRAAAPVAAWVVLLLSVKLGGALYSSHDDSRRFAVALQEIGARPDTAVISVEEKRNGLAAYGFTNIHWVKIWESDYPFFRPPALLHQAIGELSDGGERTIFVVETDLLPEVEHRTRSSFPNCRRRQGPSGCSFLDCAPSAQAAGRAPFGF